MQRALGLRTVFQNRAGDRTDSTSRAFGVIPARPHAVATCPIFRRHLRNGWHGIVSLLRQSVYGRLAGYEDVNDAGRLGRDPAMRWIIGGKAVERGGASTSQMGRFETELLANNENLAALADLSGTWIDRVHDHDPPRRVVLDMDSSVSPTFGEQEGTAYNGHFGCTCYHPLFVFNRFGDLERCALRPGNVHSAHGWRDVLVPVVERYKERAIRLYFRGDTAFASPEIYDYLEAEGMLYAIRLPANKVLQESIAHLLKRPVGRPPKDVRRYHASFSYQAGTWDKPRRVVAKVEWHPGELSPRVGFVVTNLGRPAERVVAFYNQRGTAEQWIKEGKNAIRWTRLSCRRFGHNALRLQLHALAYNLGNFMRTLALPDAVEQWSLTSLREKLIKIGAKIVRHGRYVTFQMRRRPRRGSTGMCMPSPSLAGFRNRFSTTTTAAWYRAFWRTGRAGGHGSSTGSCRITSCAIVTGARARGTTRARWRVWLVFPGATSWCRFRALPAPTSGSVSRKAMSCASPASTVRPGS